MLVWQQRSVGGAFVSGRHPQRCAHLAPASAFVRPWIHRQSSVGYGILVALAFLAVGILTFVWFRAVSQSVPGPQKGTKGVFGVAGKALPIKY